MENGHFLDLNTWSRKQLYDFFIDYKIPFFSTTVNIDVTEILNWCRQNKKSFSLACWFGCQRAINSIDEFRYRLRDDKVWVHDRISIGTTIPNPDNTFRFCYFPFNEKFDQFSEVAKALITSPPPEELDPEPTRDDLIYGSTFPWMHFTSVTHPLKLVKNDCVPMITFGAYKEFNGRMMMPVAVEVHHALMDGVHVGQFYKLFEEDMAKPEIILC